MTPHTSSATPLPNARPSRRQLAVRPLVAAPLLALITIVSGLILVSHLEKARDDLRRAEARQVVAGRTTAVSDSVGQLDKAVKGLAYAVQQANGDFGLNFQTVGSYTQAFLGGDVLAAGPVNGPLSVYPGDRSSDVDATLPCSKLLAAIEDPATVTVTLVDRLPSTDSRREAARSERALRSNWPTARSLEPKCYPT